MQYEPFFLPLSPIPMVVKMLVNVKRSVDVKMNVKVKSEGNRETEIVVSFVRLKD